MSRSRSVWLLTGALLLAIAVLLRSCWYSDPNPVQLKEADWSAGRPITDGAHSGEAPLDREIAPSQEDDRSRISPHGLEYWQKKYSERLSQGNVTIVEIDDWWFDDEEVMAAYQVALAIGLKELGRRLEAQDSSALPYSSPALRRFEAKGVTQIGCLLQLDTVRQLPIGAYEVELVGADLQSMASCLEIYGGNPFAADRPLISLAEMNSNPFQYPIEYFLQAYSGEDTRLDWPSEIISEATRIWRDFAAERAITQREYNSRVSAIGDTARELGLIVPHPAHYDRLLPGTSALREDLLVCESEYLRQLRRIVTGRQ